jgi:hypothetical protein
MHVKRHAMPHAEIGGDIVRHVGKKNPEDDAIQNRIRAHIRARMVRLGIGPTQAALKLGCHQGTLSNILLGHRGFGVGFAARVADGLNIDHMHLFTVDPEAKYFRVFVPNPTPDPTAGAETGRKSRTS